jgi:tRNA uridine 5-carbamoylmethylation protein Kti12
MTQQLILLRGLPGSGKSTFAKLLLELTNPCGHSDADHLINYEADQYFIDKEGNYEFDGMKIGQAHEWCQEATERALNAGLSVVVSNTFTRIRELQPYLAMASHYKVQVTVLHVEGTHGSIHGIPPATMGRMRARWEMYDPKPKGHWVEEHDENGREMVWKEPHSEVPPL